jgi:hypothetical protein
MGLPTGCATSFNNQRNGLVDWFEEHFDPAYQVRLGRDHERSNEAGGNRNLHRSYGNSRGRFGISSVEVSAFLLRKELVTSRCAPREESQLLALTSRW